MMVPTLRRSGQWEQHEKDIKVRTTLTCVMDSKKLDITEKWRVVTKVRM